MCWSIVCAIPATAQHGPCAAHTPSCIAMAWCVHDTLAVGCGSCVSTGALHNHTGSACQGLFKLGLQASDSSLQLFRVRWALFVECRQAHTQQVQTQIFTQTPTQSLRVLIQMMCDGCRTVCRRVCVCVLWTCACACVYRREGERRNVRGVCVCVCVCVLCVVCVRLCVCAGKKEGVGRGRRRGGTLIV